MARKYQYHHRQCGNNDWRDIKVSQRENINGINIM